MRSWFMRFIRSYIPGILTMFFMEADNRDIIKNVLLERADLTLTDEQAEAVEDAVLQRVLEVAAEWAARQPNSS